MTSPLHWGGLSSIFSSNARVPGNISKSSSVVRTHRVIVTIRGSLVTRTVIAFLKNESGATAIEYGLIAAGISVAIIAVVNGLGTSLNDKFKSVSDQLK
jgi:pilus assembly protein Flp/PilA